MFTAQQDEQILGKKNREISSSNTFQKDGLSYLIFQKRILNIFTFNL